MAYTPENNPYIPGDPYSYDLKWIVDKLKEAISLYQPLNDKFDALSDDFDDLKNYVDNYFTELDLTAEVQTIIDQMRASGFFDQLISEIVTESGTIESTTTAWLNANVDPVGSAVAVDASLSISGAAADAKITGDYAKTRLGIIMQGSGHFDDTDLTVDNTNLEVNGALSPSTNFKTSPRYPVGDLMNYVAILESGNNGAAAITFYSANNDTSCIGAVSNISTTDIDTYTIHAVPANARYFRFCGRKTHATEILFFRDYGKQSENSITWLSRMASGGNKRGLIHFSFDDVWEPLYKLISQSPASIYDISEFSALRSIHNATGACFTLNCFNYSVNEPSYDISNVPDTWAAEFTAATDWLKFAFHGKDENANYSTDTTLANDYAKCVSAIAFFTGTTESIDIMPRLGYYAGSLSQIQAVKQSVYPPIGFLGPDDLRQGYYLDYGQSIFVRRHSILFENSEQLIFVCTIPRIDSNDVPSQIDFVTSRLADGFNYLECFSHTFNPTILNRMQTFSNWCNTNGFLNGYAYKCFR